MFESEEVMEQEDGRSDVDHGTQREKSYDEPKGVWCHGDKENILELKQVDYERRYR